MITTGGCCSFSVQEKPRPETSGIPNVRKNSGETTARVTGNSPSGWGPSPGSETVSFQPLTPASRERLDVATAADFSALVTGYSDKTVAGTSDAVTGLTAGTTYYYRVRAFSPAQASSNSSTVTVLECMLQST